MHSDRDHLHRVLCYPAHSPHRCVLACTSLRHARNGLSPSSVLVPQSWRVQGVAVRAHVPSVLPPSRCSTALSSNSLTRGVGAWVDAATPPPPPPHLQPTTNNGSDDGIADGHGAPEREGADAGRIRPNATLCNSNCILRVRYELKARRATPTNGVTGAWGSLQGKSLRTTSDGPRLPCPLRPPASPALQRARP